MLQEVQEHVTRTFIEELQLRDDPNYDGGSGYWIRIFWQIGFLIWAIVFGAILSLYAYGS